MGTYAQVTEFKQVRALIAALAAMLALAVLAPASARADGPVTPVATFYLARVEHEPPGVEVKIVDGYLNMWMRAPADENVLVLDYRGAPWVRFDRAGVQINLNSQEYYLNQVPVPAVPPPGLTATTPPHWHSVTSGHTYMWREGRLHALADVALPVGTNFVGTWRIEMRIDGRPTYIQGGMWHRGSPSIVWFWPIVVLLACVLAAWRLRSEELDRRLRRVIELALLLALAVGLTGHYLHGRPGISATGVVFTAIALLATAIGAWRTLTGRAGLPLAILIALASLWAGLTLLPVLTHGYVLMAVPAFVARCCAAILLGGSLSLVLMVRTPLRSKSTLPERSRSAEPVHT